MTIPPFPALQEQAQQEKTAAGFATRSGYGGHIDNQTKITQRLSAGTAAR
jgi:hypothetical protein